MAGWDDVPHACGSVGHCNLGASSGSTPLLIFRTFESNA